MDFQTLETLRQKHPAWRLLAADHGPLIVGFLHRSFTARNTRSMARQDLVALLDDYLFELRETRGEAAYPKSAAAYLDDWAGDERGWLRKYYPVDSDEPHYDLTPAAEKAVDWLATFEQRQFIGTESRLMMVFELLRQIAEGTEVDPAVRIAELEKRKARIESEIRQIQSGDLALMDDTQIKDRFQQMAVTARALLGDFREVEQNFRDLDRAVRERIATWEGGKGDLLEEIFGDRDAIADSDQGKSFRAFWDLLMSPSLQEELSELLDRVFHLPAVTELKPDRRLLRVHRDWLEAGEGAQRTVARLSEQLRRYLDDQAWLENRRIMELLRVVEQHALAVRNEQPEGGFMCLDESGPEVELTFDRPLFRPPLRPKIDDRVLVEGGEEVPADALFDHVYVDKTRLAAQIRRALQTQRQISLQDLIVANPLQQGLAELVAYLSLAADDHKAVIDDAHTHMLAWVDERGRKRLATVPQVVFSR